MEITEVKSHCEISAYINAHSEKDLIVNLSMAGLLPSMERRCPPKKLGVTCGGEMTLVKNKDYKGGYAFRCKNCRKFRSAVDGSFCDTTRLSFRLIFELMFLWICNDQGEAPSAQMVSIKLKLK